MASYVELEKTNLSSLGVSAPSFNGSDVSFFATSSFLYTLCFILIVGASFYRYVVAGVLRMQASENTIRQSDEIIRKATLGLLGVFSLFLILFTVNRDLLTGDVGLGELRTTGGRVTSPVGTGSTSTSSTSSTTSGTPRIPANNDDPTGWGAIQNDPAVRADLRANNISVNKSVCVTPTQKSCTTVGGWPSETISMLKSLRSACSGSIIVTGGTEAGHSSHGPNKSPVDIGINDNTLNSCIRAFPRGPTKTWCNATYTQFGYTFCDEKFTVPHWHVFKG